MGHLEREKQLQNVSFEPPGYEEEEEKKVPQEKKKVPEKTDTETYYERILKNSLDQNTALRVKSYDMTEKKDWSVINVRRTPAFRQKLPAARDTYKERKAENAKKSEAKRTFADADLCTVREKASLEAYFASMKGGEPGVSGEDVADDPALSEYVSSILSVELNNSLFTDDYLSDHIAELWEYARKLGNYSYAKTKYPNFFAHLGEQTRALLETRAAAVSDLRTVLRQHMNLHGIRLDRDDKGFHVKLRRVEDEQKNKRTLKAEYERNLNKFLKKRVYEDEVNLARTYTGIASFKSDKAKAELDGRITANPKAMETCGDEIKAASAEMENAWKVRDGLLVDQRLLLMRYDNEKNEVKKDELRAKIVRNNRRIRLVSQHSDHYRDFLNCVTGAVPMVKAGTARFLEAENQTDMLDLVRIKCMGDFIEEALTGNQKMEARKKIATLRKDIEIKESDKVEGFEVIEKKQESANEIRELEEAVKKMTYIHMPMDMYYSKISDFKAAKTKGKRYKELRDMGKARNASAEKAAKQYAERYGMEAIIGNDRFLPLFCEPLIKDDKKIGKNGLTSLQTFALFTGFKDSEKLSSYVREEIRDRGKSFLDELTSLTPEKMQEYRCPDEPDLESPEFWHKRAMVWALHDNASVFDCFKQWNIPLTDEQCAHIMGLSKMAQGMVRDYRAFEYKMDDPICVAANDERLAGDTLTTLSDNIVYPYREGDDMVPDDKEVHDRLKRFGKTRSGLTMNIFMDAKRRNTNVLEATSYYIYEKFLSADKDMAADNLEEYRKTRDQHLKEISQHLKKISEEAFNEEKKKMQEFFPDAGDQEVRTRLLKKEMDTLRNTALTKAQEQAWKSHFVNNAGAGDLRAFTSLLRPIKYDSRGVLTEESQGNNQDFEDYISGDVKRRNRVLRRIGKEIAAINITNEMLTLDYVKKNHTALFPMVEKIHNFQNIWKEYPDFFESDAFTEEERDRIRQNVTGSRVLTNFCSAYGAFTDSFMGEEVMSKRNDMTPEEKIKWGRGCASNYEALSRTMFELDGPDGVAGAMKIRDKRVALYADKDKADKIRRASVLWSRTKAELEKVTREQGALSQKLNHLPEGSRKEKLKREMAMKRAEYGEQIVKLKAKLELADEIQSFVYEEKDDLSAEARTLFDTEMKESVIHAEYNKSYDEKIEEIKKDREKTEAEYQEKLNKIQPGMEDADPVEKKAEDLTKNAIFSAFEELEEEDAGEQDKKAAELSKKAILDAFKELEEEDAGEQQKEQEKPLEQEKKQEENILQPAVKGPEYHAETTLASGTVYEPQGYLNCWACSGAAMFNKFIELSDGQLTGKVNQYDIRGFKPGAGELKTLEEVNAITGLNLDQQWYDTNLEELYKFMGENAKNNGSIFEAADFFMKKRKDFVLNQMEFRLSGGMEKKDIEAYEVQKNLFMQQVNDVLKTGNLVAFYKSAGEHYVTITKIDGDNITYLDSLVGEGEPAREVTEPAEVLFSRDNSGNNLSITWFSKLKSPEEMKQDYPDLKYDEHEGYSYSKKEDLQAGALNLAQTKGICITRSTSDPILGNDAVKHHIYIPKLGDEPVQNMQQGNEQKMQQGDEQKMQQSGEQKMQQEEEKKEEKKEEKSGQQKRQYIVRKEKEAGKKAPKWDTKTNREEIKNYLDRMDTVIYQMDGSIVGKLDQRPGEWKKNHISRDSNGGRKARALSSIQAYFNGSTEDEVWSVYGGLTVANLQNATPEQKKMKSRALENIFGILADFDLESLNIKERKDMLSEDFFDARLVCYAVHEIPEDYFRDYEGLINDMDANCALSAEQLKELHCKWSTIYDCAPWFLSYPEMITNDYFDENEMDALLALDPGVLVEEASNMDPKKAKLFNDIALLNQAKLIGGYVPGDSIQERYEAHRKEENLEGDNLCSSALEAIRNREKTEGAWAKEASDREMTAEEKKAVEEKKAQKLREKQEKWKREEEERKKKQEADTKKQRIEKGVVLGNDLYTQANKSAVKNGKFSKEFLAAGEKFMKLVDAWADMGKDEEKDVLSNMGIRDTVDMLYVSGVPLKKFVADRYAYEGNDVMILRAYAAMIAGRQKYPIVIAKPVLNENNGYDVMTEALNIDSRALGAKKSKTGSAEYRKAQENAKKKVKYAKETELKVHAAREQGKINKNQGSEVLTTLETAMERLFELNDGSSYAYYSAVEEAGKYCRALQAIYADDNSKMVDAKTINSLTYNIIQINSKTAGFDNSLSEKYPKKGQKRSADDVSRVNALNDILKIVEAHNKKLRGKELTDYMQQIPGFKTDIGKIL